MTSGQGQTRGSYNNTPSTNPVDFVLQLHDSAEHPSKEEIAQRYAQKFHGRAEPSKEDVEFVNEHLINREG